MVQAGYDATGQYVYVVLCLKDGSHIIVKDVPSKYKTYKYPVLGTFDTLEQARQAVRDDEPDENVEWYMQYM